MNPESFREYDIRGVGKHDLSPETVRLLGRGIDTYVKRRWKGDVVVGRDVRLRFEAKSDAALARIRGEFAAALRKHMTVPEEVSGR